MEASTQPQPAVPAPVSPLQTNSNTQEVSSAMKQSKIPLLISLALFIIVVIVLAILFLMSRNNNPNTNNNTNTVSEPVIQTTAAPETTGNTSTTPSNIPDTSTNTFEARLFYLGFDYKNLLTSDTTTRVTYGDGTTQCFEEIAKGDGISLDVYSMDTSCTGVTSRLPDGENFALISKDTKTFNFSISQNNTGTFSATGIFATSTPSNYLIKIVIEGSSLEETKATAESLIKSLTFDTSKLKTELTDKITQNATQT